MSDEIIVNEEVKNLTDDFLFYLASEKRCSNHTIVSYRNDLFYFFSFLKSQFKSLIDKKQLENLTIQEFRSWLVFRKERGFSNSSTARAVSCLRSFFKFHNRGQTIQNK